MGFIKYDHIAGTAKVYDENGRLEAVATKKPGGCFWELSELRPVESRARILRALDEYGPKY